VGRNGAGNEITGVGLDHFSKQGMGNLAWAYARQAQLGDEIMKKYTHKARTHWSSGRLSFYTSAFLDVGEGLLQKLFYAIAETSLKKFGTLDPSLG